MDRKEKILKHVNQDSLGIEIGPSYNPIAPKSEGFKVHIIDHLNQEDLIKKYEDHGIDTSKIEPVDFVWDHQPYSELTGKKNHYSWIIASHLIEHTPDLIGFLKDCEDILSKDGILSLAIPDKRFCFDHFRPITGLSKIVDQHISKRTIHSPGTVAEYFLNVVSKSERISWEQDFDGNLKFIHNKEDAINGMKAVLENEAYLDVHAWCFVPHSFRLLIQDLFNLGFIEMKEVDFQPTEGCEFFVTLGRKGNGLKMDRAEVLNRIREEENMA